MPLLVLALMFAAAVQGGSTYTIAGEVRDNGGKPAAGVHIVAYPSDWADKTKQPRSAVATDAAGRFSINLDRPGKYTLFYNGSDQGYLPPFNPFFRDPNNPPPQVLLTEAAPAAQVFISVSKNGVLSGEALDTQTQLPVDDLRFTMCHVKGPCWSVNAKSATGSFSIPAPFVPFLLRITSPQFEDWLGLTGSDFSAPVTVPAGTNTFVKLLLKRRPENTNRAVSEDEKRPGINLPAPSQVSPEDNQVFNIFPRLTRLEWKPVEEAASYSVEVDLCDGRKDTRQCINPQTLRLQKNPPTSGLLTTSYEFTFIGKQPGRWRVWAVDKEGSEGFKSPWRTFVYLK
jgi:hypothetical protein